MVIIVDAGAVAEARAASTIEKARSMRRTKYAAMNTNTDATHASSTVMMRTLVPLPLSALNLKNCPVLKAINANATSGRNEVYSTTTSGTKFMQ